MDSIEIIKKSLSLLSTEETHRLGILPNKGEVQLKTQIVVLTSKTIHIKDSVFDKNKITPSLIVHETVHLVNRLFIFKGVELDAKNDETQAYLTEYVFDKLTEITEKLILARDL